MITEVILSTESCLYNMNNAITFAEINNYQITVELEGNDISNDWSVNYCWYDIEDQLEGRICHLCWLLFSRNRWGIHSHISNEYFDCYCDDDMGIHIIPYVCFYHYKSSQVKQGMIKFFIPWKMKEVPYRMQVCYWTTLDNSCFDHVYIWAQWKFYQENIIDTKEVVDCLKDAEGYKRSPYERNHLLRIEHKCSHLKKLDNGGIIEKTRCCKKGSRRYAARHWNLGSISSKNARQRKPRFRERVWK